MTDITPEILLRAYAQGIFPMAEARDASEVFWVDPRRRGIMPLDGFHISRSLARRMRKSDYQIVLDGDFVGVIDACANRPETWINTEIRGLYLALHVRGAAHSLEVMREGRLIGGVYGVVMGAAFFGESMFSRETDASKLALAHLCDHLDRQGFRLFDTQFLTPHLASLGAIEITRDEYHQRLTLALRQHARFVSDGPMPTPHEVMQRNTHTS